MSIPISMMRDISGNQIYVSDFNDCNFRTILSQNVAQSVVIPSNGHTKRFVASFSFEGGSSVWITKNATATIPTSSFTQTTAVRNPTAKSVVPGDTLSFITRDSTAEVCVELYEVS